MKPIAQSVAAAVETLATKIQTLTVTKSCYVCGHSFETRAGPMAQYVKTCQPCLDKQGDEDRARHKREEEERRQLEWLSLCPKDYLTITQDKLPIPGKLDEILRWEFGPKGLVLFGDTGRGKTRCAWALLAREHASGRTVASLDSMAGLEYAALYAESAKLVKKWADKLIFSDILILDDIFKVKLTDSFEGAVFTLVDQRIQNQRPTFVTSNDTGATLAARMTQDRGNPLLRRLREHCIQINF